MLAEEKSDREGLASDRICFFLWNDLDGLYREGRGRCRCSKGNAGSLHADAVSSSQTLFNYTGALPFGSPHGSACPCRFTFVAGDKPPKTFFSNASHTLQAFPQNKKSASP